MKKKLLIMFAFILIVGLIGIFLFSFFYPEKEKKEYMRTFFRTSHPNYMYIEKDGKGKFINRTGKEYHSFDYKTIDKEDSVRKTILGIWDHSGDYQRPSGLWGWTTFSIHTGDVFNYDYMQDFWDRMVTRIVHHKGADIKVCFLGRDRPLTQKEKKIMVDNSSNCIKISSGDNLILPKPKNNYNIINEQLSSSGYAEFTRHLEDK